MEFFQRAEACVILFFLLIFFSPPRTTILGAHILFCSSARLPIEFRKRVRRGGGGEKLRDLSQRKSIISGERLFGLLCATHLERSCPPSFLDKRVHVSSEHFFGYTPRAREGTTTLSNRRSRSGRLRKAPVQRTRSIRTLTPRTLGISPFVRVARQASARSR